MYSPLSFLYQDEILTPAKNEDTGHNLKADEKKVKTQ